MRAFLVTGVLAAAALLAGCGGGDGEEEQSADEIVARSSDATGAVKSFHFVLRVENPPSGEEGLNLTFAEGDLAVPNRIQADVAGTLSGFPFESQLVAVGSDYFIKDPLTGVWRTIDVETNPTAFFDPAKGVLAVMEGATELDLAGSESIGGKDSHRVRGKVAARDLSPLLGNPPSDKLVDVELWVGKEDSLLRRVRIDGPVQDVDPDDVFRTVEISDFGKQVEIERPDSSE